MGSDELHREAMFLGSLCGIIYDEYYVPNCEGKPIARIGFFLSPEFIDTCDTIDSEVMKELKERAKKISEK